MTFDRLAATEDIRDNLATHPALVTAETAFWEFLQQHTAPALHGEMMARLAAFVGVVQEQVVESAIDGVLEWQAPPRPAR